MDELILGINVLRHYFHKIVKMISAAFSKMLLTQPTGKLKFRAASYLLL